MTFPVCFSEFFIFPIEHFVIGRIGRFLDVRCILSVFILPMIITLTFLCTNLNFFFNALFDFIFIFYLIILIRIILCMTYSTIHGFSQRFLLGYVLGLNFVVNNIQNFYRPYKHHQKTGQNIAIFQFFKFQII